MFIYVNLYIYAVEVLACGYFWLKDVYLFILFAGDKMGLNI